MPPARTSGTADVQPKLWKIILFWGLLDPACQLFGGEFAQLAANPCDTDIVLIQVLTLVGIRFHFFEHDTVLFKHSPVTSFQAVFVQETP